MNILRSGVAISVLMGILNILSHYYAVHDNPMWIWMYFFVLNVFFWSFKTIQCVIRRKSLELDVENKLTLLVAYVIFAVICYIDPHTEFPLWYLLGVQLSSSTSFVYTKLLYGDNIRVFK